MFNGAQSISLQDTVISAPVINNYNTYISSLESVSAFPWFVERPVLNFIQPITVLAFP